VFAMLARRAAMNMLIVPSKLQSYLAAGAA
jgi:hypothetical protein